MPQSTFKTIDSLDVAGKRVLVRLDLNVPMKNGKVTDATRIERAAPTVAITSLPIDFSGRVDSSISYSKPPTTRPSRRTS